MKLFRLCLLCLLALPLLPLVAQPPGASQPPPAADDFEEPEEGDDQLFGEVVEVNVVNVDVFVTDRDGKNVKGLTAADFELYEDGRRVEVSNFYAVDEGAYRPEGGAPLVAKVDPDRRPEATRLAPLPVPEDQQLHLILYFDNQFLAPFSRNKVIYQVRTFLREHVEAGDQVMLVSFDKSLHVRHPFTSDRLAISDALNEIETVTGYATSGSSERREAIRSVEMSRTQEEAESHVESYAKRVFNDLEASTRSLRELVGSLAGIPGRKAILYVTDGIPMTAAEDLFYMLDLRFRARSTGNLLATRYTARRLFRELVAQANANRVTFYTLEAAGLRAHGSLSAEYGGSGGNQLTDGSYAEIDFVRMSNNTAPLQMMALDTGGLAAFSTNDIAGALSNMGRDFRTYYSLGYMPAASGSGRYHTIDVKVKRKGAKIRHRTGYRDKTASTRVSEGTVASLLYGIEANPLEVEVEIGQGQPREDGNYLVPIRVRIPIGKLVLIPQTEVHQGRVRVSLAVVDEDGLLSPVEQTPVPIAIPNADIEVARTKFYVYEAQLLMRKGGQRVAVGVRDDLAGQTSYVRQSVQI